MRLSAFLLVSSVGCAGGKPDQPSAGDPGLTDSASPDSGGSDSAPPDSGTDSGADTGPGRPWHPDADGDGFGDAARVILAPAAPVGHVEDGTDCDDADPAVHPSAEEACDNGVDDDCAGGDARCALEGTIGLADAPVKYRGGAPGELAGSHVTCGGDTDGDGTPELLIGATEQFADDLGDGVQIGGAWLVRAVTEGVHELDAEPARLWGDEEGGFAGAAIFLEDLDGNGFDEVLMGSGEAQEAYVFEGPITRALGRSDADTRVYQPEGGLHLGWAAVAMGPTAFAVSGIGNLHQDGRWGQNVGGAFVFEGPPSAEASTDDAVASISPAVEHAYGSFGYSLCSGDLDGDGASDLAIGAPAVYPTSYPAFMEWGAVYVVHGPFSGDLRVAEANGALRDAEARIQGTSDASGVGVTLSCGGDADGDGRADVLIGTADWDGTGASGDAFLLPGPVLGEVKVTDAPGRVIGSGDASNLGHGVSLDADLDGDGRDDALVGAASDTAPGLVAIFYGGFTGVVDPAAADATLLGEQVGDTAGVAAGCPDLDGDGFDDVLVGAAGESSVDTWAGAAYVVFGGGG